MSRQLSLPIKPVFHHGGRRKNAGRPNRSGLQAHVARPRLSGRHPVHITLKLREGLPSLRRKDVFRCLREAVRTARKGGLAVNHFAVLSNHIHLILEPSAAGAGTLIQSLGISFAKRLNVAMGCKGSVFLERYHQHVLMTPTEVREALAYVLTNEARHRSGAKFGVRVDPFSSAYVFTEWKALLGRLPDFELTNWNEDLIRAWLDGILAPARTWLLRTGWTRGHSRQ